MNDHMTPLAQRIYEKANLLIREKDDVHAKMNALKHTIDQDKRLIHSTEFKIVSEGAVSHASGVPDFRLAGEIRDLGKHRKTLQDDEQTLKDLTVKYNALIKAVDEHHFWMYRADTTDIAKQQEAERKIFG